MRSQHLRGTPCAARRFARAAFAAIIASGASTGAVAQLATDAPGLGDAYLAWTMHRMDSMQSEDDFLSDEALASQLLASPASIYSELSPAPTLGQDTQRQRDAWWRLKWEMRRKRDAEALSDPELARELAWDLGFTKARPGWYGLPTVHVRTQGDLFIYQAVNLEKAGTTKGFIDKGLQLSDPNGSLTALGAELAVSVEILREWAAKTPQAQYHRLGIDIEVVQRFMAASSLADLTDGDLAYLASILRSELSTWRAGRQSRRSLRELPTPLRLARAAMVHWQQSAPVPPACLATDGVDMAHATDVPEDLSSAICTPDAIDRGVYRRYLALRKFQLGQLPAQFTDYTQAERLIRAFGHIRPAWAGFFRDDALAYSNHAEVVEAQMAVESESTPDNDIRFWRLVERANLLVCRSAAR
jgi:hypothetical protein